MLLEPLFIAGLVAMLWRRAVSRLVTRAGLVAHARAGLAGLGAAAVAIAGLFVVGGTGAAEEPVPAFPGERIRTAIEPETSTARPSGSTRLADGWC
jgi:hypothetical protein